MSYELLFIASAVVSAGTAVYSSNQQAKTAANAAEFNAEQQRKAAKVKADDAGANALRRQEEHRKYMANLRAKMLEDNNAIEGGDLDFLTESAGNLQMRILDHAAASNREQAQYANNAFRYDFDAQQARQAGALNTAAAVTSGFNSVYQTGYRAGTWGQADRIPQATQTTQPTAI